MWRTDGFERPGAGNALAAKPVLGLPEMQPSLLDDVSVAAGRCPRSRAAPRRHRHGSSGSSGSWGSSSGGQTCASYADCPSYVCTCSDGFPVSDEGCIDGICATAITGCDTSCANLGHGGAN